MSEPIPDWQPPLVEKFVSSYSSNLLIHYFGDVSDWHGYVKFLSLAALRETSRDVPLEKLFVEPRLASQHLQPDALEATPPPPTEALSAALVANPRLVLLGDPGSGKSTVVNWICTALGRGMDGPLAKLLGGPLVPLPFVLREMGVGGEFAAIKNVKQRWILLLELFLQRPVAAQLRTERNKPGRNLEDSLLVKLLESGQAMLLLDGIDEIGSVTVREALCEAVHEGMRRYPRCRWVLTSRVVGYEEVEFDNLLIEGRKDKKGTSARFSVSVNFPELDESSLSAERAAEIVADGGKRIFSALEKRKLKVVSVLVPSATRLYIAPFSDAQIEQFTRFWWGHHESNPHLVGTKPAQFLTALRASHGAHSLARLPHLLTMIAQIYRVMAEFPDGRAQLYKLIAETYLGTLDKERGLEHLRPIPHSLEEMSRWLAAIGWHLQLRRGEKKDAASGKRAESEVLIEREDLLCLLEKIIRPKPGDDPRRVAELFLEFAGRRSGLLLPRGEGRYAFLHLSFQEYFAALYLRDQVADPEWWQTTEEKTPDASGRLELREHAAQPAWRETLIFLWESASLISPKLPQSLLAELFGWPRDPSTWAYVAPPTVAQMEDKEHLGDLKPASKRVFLAAALSVNPHIELTDAARQALWERCWSYEVGWQDASYRAKAFTEFYAAGIARSLLSRPGYLAQSIAILLAIATKAQPIALNLSDTITISDLSPFARLGELEVLDIGGCTAIRDLSPLAPLGKLEMLFLNDCPSIRDLLPLARLRELGLLQLTGCTGVSDLSPLARLYKLRYLDLGGCTGISDLSPLAGLGELTDLDLGGCTGISDLSPLAGLGELTDLDLGGCTGISDLSPLAGLDKLTTLDLKGCTGVSSAEIEGLKNPQVRVSR